jgi:hypothetical protein
MKDTLLNAMMAPTNFIASFSRWDNGDWSIESVSRPTDDVYKLMVITDSNRSNLIRIRNKMFARGAAASEFCIVRATFEEIEEVNLGRIR